MSPFCLGLAALLSAAPPVPGIGINVAATPEHRLFVNVLQHAKPWGAFVPGGRLTDSGAQVPVDPLGLPLKIPYSPPEGAPSVLVRTVVFNGLAGAYPRGAYRLSWLGRGVVVVGADARPRVLARPGPVWVRPTDAGMTLEIRRSDPDDPIRGLRWSRPKDKDHVLSPPVVDRLRGFSVLRVADATRAADPVCSGGVPPQDLECRVRWADRTPADAIFQASRGIAFEHLFELAKKTGSDLWVSIPLGADPEYARSLAEMADERLGEGQRLYLEVATDPWGDPSPVRARLEAESDPEEAYVSAAVRAWEAAVPALGERLVAVLAGDLADPERSDRLLAAARGLMKGRARPALALAVDARFGGLVAESLGRRPPLDDVFHRLEASLGAATDKPSAPTFTGRVRAQARVAERHGAALVASRAGVRLAPLDGRPLSKALLAAHRDPRMAALFDSMFARWFDAGGTVMALDRLVAGPLSPGGPGLLEHAAQFEEDAPKLWAVRSWLVSLGAEPSPPRLRSPDSSIPSDAFGPRLPPVEPE